MQLQCKAIDYYSLILVGHGPTLFIFGGAMAYTAYTVPTPMGGREGGRGGKRVMGERERGG